MTKRVGDARPLRIHQAIAARLGSAILSGEYRPGDGLEGEIEQSAALGVSRTPYREALRILVAKGLLESRPKAGTRVTPRERWNVLDPDVLAWMFTGQPDEAFVRDLFELRGVIEPAAAALAATRRTDTQLATMERALAAMGAHSLATQAGQDADRQFHHAILQATGNQAFAALCSSIGAAVQWTTRFKQRASASPRDPLPDHQAVFAAISAGDAAAASAAMAQLVHLALDDTARALPQTGDHANSLT